MDQKKYENALRATTGIDPQHDADSLHTAWVECQCDDLTILIGRARNRAKDEYRRRRKHKTYLHECFSDKEDCTEKKEDPIESLVREETQRIVRSVLNSLPSIYAKPGILFWIEGLRPDEIARTLGRPIDTIYGQLRRLKLMLAQNETLKRVSNYY